MKTLSVLSPSRFNKILVSDSKNVSRDPVLMFAILMSVVPAITFVLARQSIDEAALPAFGLADFSTYLAPIVLGLPAALIGWVTGFLILEERDDGPLLALDTTPVGKAGFTLHRATVTFAITFLITLVATPRILPGVGFGVVMVLAVFVGLQAVILAFAIPAIARNKVEGLAATKILNTAVIIPLLALLPSPLRYLAGFVPNFWLGELLELSSWLYLTKSLIIAVGLVIHIVVLWLFFRLLERRAG